MENSPTNFYICQDVKTSRTLDLWRQGVEPIQEAMMCSAHALTDGCL
jgi:hypothetical protein